MRQTRGHTARSTVSILLVTGLTGCSSGTAPTGGGTDAIVIAADLNSASATDNGYAQALRLRMDQVNASGRLGSRKLALRTQDNRADPATSLRNISAFAADPSVAATITGSCDECAVGAAQTIDALRLPTIALSLADAVASPVADRRFLFKLGPNSTDTAAVLGSELRRVKAATLAVLSADDLYGHGSFSAISSEAAKAGIKVTAARTVRPNTTNLTPTVRALLRTKPDALLVSTAPEQALLANAAAKAAGFAGRIYFDAGAASDLFLPANQVGATEDTVLVFTPILAIDDIIATTPAKAARKQWFSDYTARFGGYSGTAAFAADAVDLLTDAIVRSGSGTDRGHIRDTLETEQLDGLSGPIRFTPTSHSGLLPQALALLVARSGRWRLIAAAN